MRLDREGQEVARRAARGRGRRLWMVLAIGLLAVLSCTNNDPPETDNEPTAPTTLRVENSAFLDMTIYVLRSSQRTRLGVATGLSVTKFTIPKSLIFGATSLAFYASPIGGHRTPVSQEISVSPGDEVQLMIPPE